MTKVDKDLEEVLVTENNPSIHYSTGDYFHYQANPSEGWKDEVITNAKFVVRWQAEQDTSILQLIPYILVIHRGKVLSYQRKGGGEGRLEGSYSVGIGGHINNEDTINDISWDIVREGAIREINEEIGIVPQKEKLNFIGTIYTPSNVGSSKNTAMPNVGQVHIGIVYTLQLDDSEMELDFETTMLNTEFISKPLNTIKYEKWSQLILNRYNDIIDGIPG